MGTHRGWLLGLSLAVAGGVFWAGAAGGGEDGAAELLFRVGFDSFNVTADHARGNPRALNWPNPDLQLRMHPGVGPEDLATMKNNALEMAQSEWCEYEAQGNFNAPRGTVSLWVSSRNWKPSKQRFIFFFVAETADYTLMLYKYVEGQNLLLYLRSKNGDATTRHSAKGLLDDADWEAGRWHHIAAAWDENGATLYIDGRVAEPNGAIRFPEPLAVPSLAANARMRLGALKWSSTDPEDRTAFDELRIYDKPLPAAEIRRLYEEFADTGRGMAETASALTVPRVAAAGVAADGRVDAVEWRDAALVPVRKVGHNSRNREAFVNADAQVKYDAERLYVAFRSDRPPALARHTERDGTIWEDDAFELHLGNGTGNTWQYIVNSLGAVYDARDGDKTWNGNAAIAAARTEGGGWSAELAIPLADLGHPGPGDAWRGNFCATNYEAEINTNTWSRVGGEGGYGEQVGWGDIRFGADDWAVRLEGLGDIAVGQLALALSGAGGAGPALSASYTTDRGQTVRAVAPFPEGVWRAELPPGNQALTVETPDRDGKRAFSYGLKYYVNAPLELVYVNHPLAGEIAANLNLSGASPETRARLRDGGLPGSVTLLDSDGTERSRAAIRVEAVEQTAMLPLPPDLPEGVARLRAEIADGDRVLTKTVDFPVPDMAPYRARVADDHAVPPPWKAVEALPGGVYLAAGKRFEFGDGVLPGRIVVGDGAVILPAVPEFLLDGRAVSWDAARVVESRDDCVTRAAEARAGALRLSLTTELWFDGTCRLVFSMEPAAGAEARIENLVFAWSVDPAAADYVMAPGYQPWGQGELGFVRSIEKAGCSQLWLTGQRAGLAWWGESEANWSNAAGEKNLWARRGANRVDAEARMITRPEVLKGGASASYTMALTATPAKAPPADWRRFNFGGWEVPKRQNAQSVGWASHAPKPAPDDTWGWMTHIPRDPDAYRAVLRDRWRKAGIKPFAYGAPAHMATIEPEYAYFFDDWRQIPPSPWQGEKEGVKFMCEPACPGTGVADLQAWRVERLLRDQPDLAGLYYDLWTVNACSNERHGCAGVDAFGKKYRSSTAWGLRQYMIRMYKLLRAQGCEFIGHVGLRNFHPLCHGFADYYYPGEELMTPYAENPDYFYCEGMPPEEWQASMGAANRGVGCILLPQMLRAANYIAHIKAREEQLSAEDDWTLRVMTPVLLHDALITADWVKRSTVDRWWGVKDGIAIEKADFTGYWQGAPYRSGSPDVRISVYAWETPSPYAQLLIAGNLGRQPRPLALEPPPPAGARLVNLWTGDEIPAAALGEQTVAANHCLLIGVEPRK